MQLMDGPEDPRTERVDWATWRSILGYALRHRLLLGLLLLQALIAAACDATFPLITRAAIDAVRAEGAGFEVAPHALRFAAVAGTLATAIFFFIRLAGAITARVAHDIRAAAFARLQELSFAYFDRRPVGWIMARMTSDCDRLSRIVSWGLVDFVWGVTLMLAIAAILVWLDARLALIVLLVVPPLAWVSSVFQRRILRSARVVRRLNSMLNAAYSEALMGVRTTRLLAREEAALGEFQSLSGEMRRASVHNALQSAVYLPLVLTLSSLGTGLALAFGGAEVAGGALSLGSLIAFLTYTVHFFDPVQDVARLLAELQMAQAAAERVMGLLATQPEVRDSAVVRARIARASAAGVGGAAEAGGAAVDGLRPRIGRIELRDVCFAYGGGREVLERVSIDVEAGERIALVGPTGGGKTTLTSLLLRFYEPTAGGIYLDGIEYRERSLAWLRSQCAVVLQTPHLFRGTVRDDIRYGRLDASDAEIEEAARAVGAHPFIAAMEHGYDTEVGEGGLLLSAGQRQLVSLARALLKRAPVLVLDEATSSVDGETERVIEQGLKRLLDGPTSFLIAHRLSTIRESSRILFVDHGRIVESGSHRQLMAARGRYHDLYVGQSLQAATRGGARWAGAAPGGAAGAMERAS